MCALPLLAGGTWFDLCELVRQSFGIPDRVKLVREDFQLRHARHGILYSNFELEDLEMHSLLVLRIPPDYLTEWRHMREDEHMVEPASEEKPREIREMDVSVETRETAMAIRAASQRLGGAGVIVRVPSVFGPGLRESPDYDDGEEDGSDKESLPESTDSFGQLMRERVEQRIRQAFKVAGEDRRSKWRKQVWEFVDDPSSSLGAKYWNYFMMALIAFSTITFTLETLPFFFRQVEADKFGTKWFIMEAFAIGMFTLEIAMRLATCSSVSQYFFPRYGPRRGVNWMNWIDVVAIVPFYVELFLLGKADIPGLQVLRVIRLVRVLRLFKMGKSSLTVFAKTLKTSAQPLSMLAFFLLMGVIIFASLIYYCERGDYDEELTLFKRSLGWQCLVPVSEPEGVLVDQRYLQDNAPRCTIRTQVAPNQAILDCLFEYRSTGEDVGGSCLEPALGREGSLASPGECLNPPGMDVGAACVEQYSLTPFKSIPASLWWAIVTMLTVGYGDMFPTTWYGKVVASLVMIFGLLVLALPISVIGSTFANAYFSTVAEAKREKESIEALQALQGAMDDVLKAAEKSGGKELAEAVRADQGDRRAHVKYLQQALQHKPPPAGYD